VVQGRPLEVDGYGGEPLPCVLYPTDEARGSAVVFPGGARAGYRLGGTPARPDLNYVRVLLLGLGVSVLEVWWHADEASDDEEGERWLAANAAAGAAAAAQAAPLRVAVARSWGSRALAKLVLADSSPATTVWITPLLRHAEIRDALARCAASACVVAATADPFVPEDDVRPLEAAGATVVRIHGANHGLEVGGAAASARALADALDELQTFLEPRLRT
jgi:hypothetical protein